MRSEERPLRVIHPLEYAAEQGLQREIYQYPRVDVLSSVPLVGRPKLNMVGRPLVFCVELEGVYINGIDAVTLGERGAVMFHHLCSWHYNTQGILSENKWLRDYSENYNKNDLCTPSDIIDVECVYTGGSPQLNFGHLFWQGLSRICVGLQGNHTRGLPIAVPDNIPERWLEFYEMMGYGPSRRILYAVDRPVRFRRVWMTSLPFYRGNITDSIPYVWDKAIWLLRDRLTASRTNLSSDIKRRLFVSRKGASIRRIINYQEVISTLIGYGFVEVEPAEMTAAEQIKLFSSARCVVFAAGASSPLPLFLPNGASVIELLPRGVEFVVGGAPTYTWITRHPHQRIFGDAHFLPDNPSKLKAETESLYNRDKDYIVPIDELKSSLDIEANSRW